MLKLLLLGLIGLAAQLIDGALGMAYGVTSTSLLLAAGLAPAIASATVHLAELGTTLASGLAHWRFGNVNWRAVALLSGPGFAGAFLGAVVLTSLPAETAKPWVAGFLFCLGLYILARFTRHPRPQVRRRPHRWFFLSPLGLFAGFLDAAGGGGWGPIGTPTLLASNRMAPRKVIGTVDTAEFMVALGASLGFLVAFSFSGVNTAWVGALLAGGVIAAPIAAWLVRKLPARVLGSLVGGLILVTNARTIADTLGIQGDPRVIAYLLLVTTWTLAVTVAVRAVRRERLVQA